MGGVVTCPGRHYYFYLYTLGSKDPLTRPTYDAKQHPDPIRRFSTMHWTDRPTHRTTDRPRESLVTIGLGRYASNESDAA